MGSTTSTWLPVGSAPAALIVAAAVTCRKRLRARTCSSCSSSTGSRNEGDSVADEFPRRSSLLLNDSATPIGDTPAGATSTTVQVQAFPKLPQQLSRPGADNSAGATSATSSVQASQELPTQLLRPGSIGTLGAGCLREHRGRPAIVTEVAASHCTVSVLDPSLQSALDQCWPNLADFAVEQRLAEMGSRVVIQGLQGKRTQWCNSLVGTVVAHPTKGHPCFIQKAGAEHPLLVLCIKLDNPPPEGQKQVLMELRFLVPVGSTSKTLQGG